MFVSGLRLLLLLFIKSNSQLGDAVTNSMYGVGQKHKESLIVTFAVSATVFEIFTVKDRKLLISPTTSLFDAPYRRNAIRYPRNLYTAEKCI